MYKHTESLLTANKKIDIVIRQYYSAYLLKQAMFLQCYFSDIL
jgi:hypothetical protein